MPSVHATSGARKGSASEKSSLVSGFDNQVFGRDYGATSGSMRVGETKKTEEDSKKRTRAPVLSLYRYGTSFDIFLLIVGILAAIVTGAGMPIISILFGDMTNSFLSAQTSPVNRKWVPPIVDPFANWSYIFPNVTVPPIITDESFESSLVQFCVYYSYVGAAIFVAAYLMTVCWCTVCERVMNRIRREFFYAILRQEAAWFDVKQSGELTSRLSDDLERIKEGIGDKMGLMFQNIAQFLTGYVVAFTRNWQLSLVMLAAMPFIVVFGGLLSKSISGSSRLEQEKYAAAGGIAEEVISCVRTVISFNGQKKEVNRYGAALQDAKKLGIRKQFLTGLNVGIIMLVIFSSYALAFWFGAKLIVDGTIEKGQVFTVFMCVLFGSFALSTAAPQLGLLAVAQGAASAIYDIIDNRPPIDPYSRLGEKPKGCKGLLTFEDVQFAYPTRPEVKIFKDLSFTVEPGNKVAFVGPSGCGKSTVVNMLLRFYDPDSGRVTLDGIDLKTLNLHWLRNTIGVVSQEPILFDATIAENIKYGRPDVNEKEMIRACKSANAHEFIMHLPQGYQTMVGERGTQLSGGQKQRIAIARSLVRDPKILLLDEATSALDAESESVVQEALEKAQEGRTTIIVAHRLSTIRNADKIIALQDGDIKEMGTHAELMKLQGVYYDLIMAQTFEDAGYVTGSAAEDNGDASDESDSVEVQRELSRRHSKTPARRQLSKRSSVGTPSRMSSKRKLSQRQLSRMMSKNPATVETDRIKEALKEEGIEDKSTFSEIASAGKQEWPYLLVGFTGAAIRGVVMPLFSYVYSEIFSVYSMEGKPLLDAASNRCLWFVGIGIVQFVGVLLNMHFLGMSGENFVMRLRLKVFENILRMDGAYFDEEKHSTGKLCTRLSSDAPNVKSAIDYRTSSVLVSAISMVAGLVMGIIFGWQMALMVIAMLPVLGLASFINMKLRTGSAMRDTELLEDAGKTAAESIENVKTVQYLTREMTFYEAFCHHLAIPYKTQLRNAHIHAFGYAFANACFYFIYAASFRFGGFMVIKGEMDPVSVFRVFNCVVFASMTIGGATAFFGEFAKARLSGALIFKMMKERPNIDSYSAHGLKPNVKGDIKFNEVFFRYPTRPDTEILKDFSVTVESGKTLALVGQSGCGKSTTVSLIERFYDPWDGGVMLDDFDLKTINIRYLRDQISIVSQEPILFDCSIRDNIAYGVDAGVSHEHITTAAKQANIHDFILSLPEGYNTRVGEKGTQLSGGQKQRVAIARALVRRPKILLLDEATSALDTESEKIVQEALDRARQGRTCIIIAHRLSTVQTADTIAVIKGGKIVEKGTHHELISKHGVYFELTKKQTVEANKY